MYIPVIDVTISYLRKQREKKEYIYTCYRRYHPNNPELSPEYDRGCQTNPPETPHRLAGLPGAHTFRPPVH